MHLKVTSIILLLLASVSCRDHTGTVPGGLSEQRMLMGTTFAIQIAGVDESVGTAALEAAFEEIARVEELLSEWRDTSEISLVNREAGRQPVVVGPELFAVVQRSIWASESTGGAFDATFAGCGHLWSFKDARMPSDQEIAACLPLIDFRRIRLDEATSSVFLPDSDMRLGIAGIAKGYGVDRAAEVLEAHGVTNYIVDGGGDIRLRGHKEGRPWRVGIADPRRHGELYGTLALQSGSVVTSGDYEQYFEHEGVAYHHILDPGTGQPARRSVAVTIIAPTAMDADALATGVFVLGPERGLALVDRLPGVEALILGPDLTPHRSAGFPEMTPFNR
jgi:thiamine biosynthesis lipoprotein